jgi:hypothetical protein
MNFLIYEENFVFFFISAEIKDVSSLYKLSPIFANSTMQYNTVLESFAALMPLYLVSFYCCWFSYSKEVLSWIHVDDIKERTTAL